MKQDKTIRTFDGETVKVSQRWAAECEKRGTTVSASAWGFTGSGSLSDETLATPLATVKVTATGSGELTNTATLANGEVLMVMRRVVVE